MSETKGKQASAPGRSADEIRDDIEATREELGDTVEQLAAKTDLKGRAQTKAAELKNDANRLANESAEAARRNPVPLAVAGLLLTAGIVRARRSR